MDSADLKKVVAEVAAQARQGKKKVEDTFQIVVFTLDGEEYGVPITDIQEIIRVSEVTPIPGAPDFILGILNLRGRIVVVVDLEKRFGLERTDDSASQHIIISEVAESTFGVVVDQVSEVLRIPVSRVQPTPAVVSSKIHTDYLNGVVVMEAEGPQEKAAEPVQEEPDKEEKKPAAKPKKVALKKKEKEDSDSAASRLIVLIDLPKMLQEKDLLSLSGSVSEVSGPEPSEK
ncbi:MAG: chemotaxis protein CheW [bacterium]